MSSEIIEFDVQNAIGKLKRFTVIGIIVHICTGFYFLELLFDELSALFSWGINTGSQDLVTGLWLIQIFYFVGGLLTVFFNYKKHKTIQNLSAISFLWIVAFDVIGLLIAFPLAYVPVIDLIKAAGNERLIAPVILAVWFTLVLVSQIILYFVMKRKLKKLCACK